MSNIQYWFDKPWLAVLACLVLLSIPFIKFILNKKWNIKAIQAHLLLLSLLCFLVAVPNIPQIDSPEVYTLILVDTSDSITDNKLAEIEADIQVMIKKYQEYYEKNDSQIAIMKFAGKERIIMPWTDLKEIDLSKIKISRDESILPDYTDITAAFETAAQYIRIHSKPRDKKQLVLLSDGNDSKHLTNLPKNAETILSGINMDIRMIKPEESVNWQWISDIAMPRTARIKEPFDIRVAVSTHRSRKSNETTLRVRLKIDGVIKTLNKKDNNKVLDLSMQPYPFPTTFPLPAFGEEIKDIGYHSYKIELIDPEGKLDSEGNEKVIDSRTRMVKFFPSAKVLIVAGRKDAIKKLEEYMKPSLQPLQLGMEFIDIGSFDNRDLKFYDLIIFYNLSNSFFTPKRVDGLKTYTEKHGGGLLFVGGDNSFDFGDYKNNKPLIDMLPVEIKEPATRLRIGKFIFLLDVSGSMEGPNLQMLKQSVVKTLESIPPDGKNEVAVYTFDSIVHDPIIDTKLNPPHLKQAIDTIQSLKAGGGTKLLPALEKAVSIGNEFISIEDSKSGSQRIDSGVRIYIYSDGNINDNMSEIINIINNANMRIQFPTMTIGQLGSSDTLTYISQIGGGKNLFLWNDKEIVHFDPGVDPNRPEIIPLYCPPSDPILGDVFADGPCPGVYGFNNIHKKERASDSLKVLIGRTEDEAASLLSFSMLGRGKIIVLGMDLHGVWSGPFFEKNTINKTVTFLKQLLVNARRSEKTDLLYSFVTLTEMLDHRIKAKLEAPFYRTGEFSIHVKDIVKPMHLTNSGEFETYLPAKIKSEFKKKGKDKSSYTLKVLIKDKESILENNEVWVEKSIIKPEKPMPANLSLLYDLHDRILAASLGYITTDEIPVTRALLQKLAKTDLKEPIHVYIKNQAGRYFANIDHLYKLVENDMEIDQAAGKLSEQEKEQLERLIDEARYTPFKPPLHSVHYVPFYSTVMRIPFIIIFLLLLFYSIATRLGKGFLLKELKQKLQKNRTT
jgi:uncharacterized protein YegL/uncharacterized membrane protein